MNEIQSVIAQLELQRASIDRAQEALREIEGTIRGAKYLSTLARPGNSG